MSDAADANAPTVANASPELTVAICTYQRDELLGVTLDSLAACDPGPMTWELIVVDNAGQDDVRRRVEAYADRLPVRYFHEASLGASFARNRAAREARAPIILFTDDDVTFEPDWLVRMAGAIQAQPQCAFWGGRVEPVWTEPQPAWFDESACPMLGDAIVQYRRGDEPRAWKPDEDPPFYTANLALRVDAIVKAGWFDTNVGHRGDKRMGMEDSLMVKAIAGAGGQGWYVADAVVHHPVPPQRATRRYIRDFAWRQGWLSAQTHRRFNRVPLWVYRLSVEGAVGGAARWIAGVMTGRPHIAFAGRFAFTYHGSRLWHALTDAKPG